MTFAPNESPRMGMSPVARTLLFWVLMIALAGVLWQMAKTSDSGKPGQTISYSDFMQQVGKNNVASARLYASQNTAEIEGELRQPPDKFKVTIPKEVIPDLTERLRKQGVTIYVSNSSGSSRLNVVLDVAPFVILGLWLFMAWQRRTKRDQSVPGEPSNRPIQ
ncbi:MAG: ATP-dependent metallopeptidase FtsH/Yme1/Tma family protein [Candidatus Acidiferrales bacterium]